MNSLNDLRRGVQDSVVSTLTGLFSHGPTPLEHTLDYPGDPGLLGPDSVSWRVVGDAAVFIGGIRALVVQSAHAEVVAGVEDHSTYRVDPLGRLSRTAYYVTETTYGAMPEVEAAVAGVRVAHRPVVGTSERGRPYSAGRPDMAAWVHNVLTDSFLAAYQAFGPEPLSTADADHYVAEQSRVGELLGADPLPQTAADLREWIVTHPDIERTKGQQNAIEFLSNPPLAPHIRVAYRLLYNAAVTTIPASLTKQLGVRAPRCSADIGTNATRGLRWALGASPAWKISLERCGAPIPPGTFRADRRPRPGEAEFASDPGA
ncbi:MAG: oxygenase MpaB family protein [Acidimicrobiales bacterium]